MISKIKKRDGRIVDFDKKKITNAIFKAARAVGGKDRELAAKLADQVVELLEKRLKPGEIPTVEQVQDLVEKVLVENRHYKTAKAYILYRQKRGEVRRAKALLGVKDELKLSLNSILVLERRYLRKDETGKVIESTAQMFRRVARAMAEVEKNYGKSEKEVKELEEKFYQMMTRLEFLPNSPTLMNAGTGTKLGLSACFVLPVEDSLESIFEAVKQTALIHKSGGGTGFSFSKIRPKGDVVKTTGGIASGPISFMTVFDAATEVIKQGGKRRGANMGILRVDHPDILDFIVCKEREGILRNFNISVAVTDKFMKAVEENKDFELINPRNGQVVKTINARAIWNLIITMAWRNGEPGVIFLDTINRANLTPHVGQIEATNPCVVGDTLIPTEFGLMRMEEIAKKYSNGGIRIAVDRRVPIMIKQKNGMISLVQLGEKGVVFNKISRAFCSGMKETYKLITKNGYELIGTPDHKVLTTEGWVLLKDCLGKEVLIQSGEGVFNKNYDLPFKVKNKFVGKNGRTYTFNFPTRWSKELGQILGLLIADGWICEGKNCRVGFSFGKDDIEVFNKIKPILNKFYGKQIKEVKRKNNTIHLSYHSKYFVNFFKQLGVTKKKNVPKKIFTAPREAVVGFLQGLFTVDGTVRDSRKSSSDWIALTSKNLKLLKEVQVLLQNFGIKSVIYNRSRPPRKCLFKYINKNGELKTYDSDGILYELGIFGSNIEKFKEKIGFMDSRKMERLNNFRFRKRRSQKFFDKVIAIKKMGLRKVYDLTEPISHSMICNSIVVHQCGEQPLLPYESCNLGSINLSKFVEDGKINWDRLRETVRLAVRFLDNVIDANSYPIPEIEKMTKVNRKIGLGVMGFADTLILLGIPYNSEEALKTAEKIMKFISEEGRKMSVELGKEKGSFPNFKGSVWEKKGYEAMRNATVTTIAPTGSISIIANCSSGIEPLFAICYTRELSESLGKSLIEINSYFETMAIEKGFYSEDLIKKLAGKTSIQDIEEIPEEVRKIFVTAHDISPEWHVRIQAAFQKFTDNAVSKTINFPYEATPQDVEKAYLLAYRLGCKGITVYRHGSREVQILKPVTESSIETLGSCPTCTI